MFFKNIKVWTCLCPYFKKKTEIITSGAVYYEHELGNVLKNYMET